MTGKTILHYKIIEELGRGGMGVVYKAHDTKLDRDVAIKFLPRHVAANAEERQRFVIEAKAAAALNHPNIATIYAIEEADDEMFIVMEYIEGRELKEAVGSRQLAVDKVVDVAIQIAAGLQAAHVKGIVHRDIKSSNIMVTDDGKVKIMDFGLAKMKGGPHMTRAGSTIGTPYYMSPEQARGEEVDARTDIWSFGVVLYEMLTAELPFKGEYEQAVIYAILNEEAPPISQKRADVPQQLETVIQDCLRKETANRYGSMEEVVDLLRMLKSSSSTTISTSFAASQRQSRPGRFFSKQLVIIAGALLLMALLTVVFLLSRKPSGTSPVGEAASQNSIAVMYFENRSSEKDLDKILVDMLTTNLARHDQLEVVSSQRLFDILKNMGKLDVGSIDKSVATDVARKAQVGTMVLGSIIQIGNQFRITSQLIRVNSGDILASDQVEGSRVEDIFAMVDELTGKISSRLIATATEANQQPLRITDATTSNYRAYQFYQRGQEYTWRWNFEKAAENFRRAIQLDSTFAMAHIQLAINLYLFRVGNHYADMNPVRKLVSTAVRHSRLAGKKEQLYIAATSAEYERRYQTAVKLFTDFVKQYPDEKAGWMQLSVLHYYGGNFKKSLSEVQKVLQLDPTYANAQNLLGYILMRNGRPREAIAAIKKYIDMQPDVENTYDSAWEIYMMAGELDSALAICEQALSIDPDWRKYHRYAAYVYLFKGDGKTAFERLQLAVKDNPNENPWILRNEAVFYLYQGRYGNALQQWDKAIRVGGIRKDSSSVRYAMIHRARLLIEMGRFEEARTAYREAKEFSRTLYTSPVTPVDVIGEYGIGISYLREGDLSAAKKEVGKIFDMVKKNRMDSLFNDYAYLLRAQIELMEDEAPAALSSLNHITGYSVNSPQRKFVKSQALAGSGKIDQAVALLNEAKDNITARNPSQAGGDYFDYFYLRSQVNYLLGRFYEQAGDIPRAIEYYTKAMAQWKNADAGHKELADARARLAKLNVNL